MKPLVSTLVAATLCAAAGCANQKNISPLPSISAESKANLSKPVNCGNARQDIDTLKKEKSSVEGQILAGVRSVFPIAAVAGILTGDYNDRSRVAVGAYNEDIEKKIRQIRVKCDVI